MQERERESSLDGLRIRACLISPLKKKIIILVTKRKKKCQQPNQWKEKQLWAPYWTDLQKKLPSFKSKQVPDKMWNAMEKSFRENNREADFALVLQVSSIKVPELFFLCNSKEGSFN